MSETNLFKSTGILELDDALGGGFPRGGLILVAGNSGAGKSIFSTKFVYNGALNGEKGIYVSFAETKADFYRNMKLLDMDLEELESKGLFRFLDLITLKEEAASNAVQFVLNEVTEFGPERLVIDSISAIAQMIGLQETRVLLHTLIGRIVKHLGVTVLLVAEVPYGESKIGFGAEEFVADGVISLKCSSMGATKKRELEILKMRGTPVARYTFQFVIDRKGRGISLITLPYKYSVEVSNRKISTGIPGLDKLLYGGVYKGSINLIKGASGTGKTAICLHFLVAGALKPRKGLLVSFEEPVGQIERLGAGLGMDISKLVKDGMLTIESCVPEALTPLEYYRIIKDYVDKFHPHRLAIDSITAIEYSMPLEAFLEFIRYLQLLVKEKNITTFLTATSGALDHADIGLSTLADNIIILRYREEKTRPIDRELLIVKTRGSAHERRTVDFIITDKGIVVHD